MVDANCIWCGLEVKTGEDRGFRQSGVVYLARADRDSDDLER